MSTRETPLRAHGAVLATALAVALGAVLAPAASADQGGAFSTSGKPTKPKPEPKPVPKPETAEPEAKPEVLKPTPQPLTAYEMPFPCDEVWTGSTRAKHSPSVRAIDFNRAGDMGDSVVAAADGVVTKAVRGKKKPSYGQHVVIDHGNDETTMYAHLDSVSVAVGQAVVRGYQVGTVGNTGNSYGAHLHFEQQQAGKTVDAWFSGTRFPMGSSAASQNCSGTVAPPPDAPLAGNMVGNDAAELVVFRRTRKPAFHVNRGSKAPKVIKFGGAADQPVLGDWDGNGRDNPGVRSAKTFRLKLRRDVVEIKFGKPSDLPIAGDWDGLGNYEVGVRRAGSNVFRLRSATGSVSKVVLGDADDLPVTGDWDGDGVTDLGVYDRATATFTLRRVDADGMEWISSVVFGSLGDLPVAGDWNGDAVTDLGVWTPATGTFSQRMADSPTALKAAKVRKQQFGRGE